MNTKKFLDSTAGVNTLAVGGFVLFLVSFGVIFGGMSLGTSLQGIQNAGTVVLSIQAESGSLAEPMQIRNDYIRTTKANDGAASYSVQIPQTGTYRIEFLVKAPKSNADSIFFSVNGSNEQDLHFYVKEERGKFVWKTHDRAVYRVALTEGNHIFTIRGREKNTEVDAFRIVLEDGSSDGGDNRNIDVDEDDDREPAVLPGPITPTRTTNGFMIEAEMGMLDGPMENKGDYIRTTQGQRGTATYTVEVPESGEYRFEFLVKAPKTSEDSLFFSVDEADERDLHLYVKEDRGEFTWKTHDRAVYTTFLTKGTHIFTIRGREKNTEIDAFRFVRAGGTDQDDDGGGGSDDDDDNVVITRPIPVSSGTIVQAEDGVLEGEMERRNDYIRTTRSNRGTADYAIDVAEAGEYRFEFLVKAPSGSKDSLYFSVDGDDEDDLHFYERDERGDFAWKTDDRSVYTATLSAGVHTLTIRGREKNTEIDAFRIIATSEDDDGGDDLIIRIPEELPKEEPRVQNGDRPWESLLDNVVGFGKNTTGGAGGELCRVTNLDDSGDGSLRDCAGDHKPQWIVFDVSGTIDLRSPLRPQNNKTIDGRGQQITLTGRGINIASRDNVIVHNIAIEDVEGDAISVYRSTNVWIDHVSMEDAGDGLLDITEQSQFVTASWNTFKNQNKTMLIGANNSRTEDVVISVTLHHNYFSNTTRRNPLARYGAVHMFNNLLEDWGEGNGGDAVNSTYGAQVLLENNIFNAGSNKRAVRITVPNFVPVEGYIKATGNLALNEAEVFSWHPERVFSASDYYTYNLETADQSLMTKIMAGAGWRNVPSPDGV